MLTSIPTSILTDVHTVTNPALWTREKRHSATQWRAGAARVGLEATIWAEQTAVPLLLSSTHSGTDAVPRILCTLLRKMLLLDAPTQDCFRSLDAVVPSSSLIELMSIEEDAIIRIILLRLKLGVQISLKAEDVMTILEDLFLRAARYSRFVRSISLFHSGMYSYLLALRFSCLRRNATCSILFAFRMCDYMRLYFV